MARRRRLSKIQLGFIAGILTVLVIAMAVGLPTVANLIIATNDSTEYKFAFPDIDNSVITELLPFEIIGGQDVISISAVDCFFKFTLLAKDASGQQIEVRQSQFSGGSGGENPFTTFSISTVAQSTSGGEIVVGGRVIDRYEITPKIRCDRTGFQPEFESGIAVLPSSIKLTTAVVQPDGTVKNAGNRFLTVQSIGADNDCDAFNNNQWVIGQQEFFLIFPVGEGQQGILKNNQEIEFKGSLGALKCSNEFFSVPASTINNLAKPQLQTYNTEVRFAISGNLNMNYIFVASDKTQIFPVYSTDVAKTVRINVDRIQDVPASEFPQSIVLTSAITGTGKCLAGLCGSTKTLNPDAGISERTVTVNAVLDDFQGVNVEGAPILTLRKVIGGSNVAGISNNPTFMQFVSGNTFRATMVLPSSIDDATYIFQVTSQTRSNIGSGSFAVSTPPPDQPQPPTCDSGQVLDSNNNCVTDPSTTPPTDPTCGSGQTLINGQCVDQFCPDGTSAVNGCTIKPVIGGQCLQGQIEELDGSCTNPLCPIGTEYVQSIQRCNPIQCSSGQEFDTTLLQCVTTSITCEANEVLNFLKTGCVKISEISTIGGVTPNILNIGQEIRYQIITEDPLGGRTPVESGTIPEDTSLFAGLTPLLQFTLEPDPDGFAKRFGVVIVDSFLTIPSTVSDPQISNVDLNQQLHFYLDNPVAENGQLNKNEPSLTVNIPSGTLGEVNRGIGGGFFQLGKFEITTSDILSAVTGVTGAFNCFEEGDVCTTIGGIEIKDGDVITIIYTVDGTFDLATEGGTKQFNGVINQMKWFKNFIFTEALLAGNEVCTGKTGKDLLQCNFDETGNNSLEGVCPEDDMKTVRENFESCLGSLSNTQVDQLQQEICSDTEELARLVDLLNTGGGKSTDDILNDLKLAFGCVVLVEPTDGVDGEAFKCPTGTKTKSGITTPTSNDDCEIDNACDELPDGTKVIGGMIFLNTDGTQECRAPPVSTNGGTPMCQTGSTRDPATGQCVFPVKTNPEETIITGLLDAFNKLLESITGTQEGLSETGSDAGGSNDGAGACLENILACALEVFGGDGEDEEPPVIIPPSLQVGGSQTSAFVIFSIIIIIIIATSAIIARSRRGRTRLG